MRKHQPALVLSVMGLLAGSFALAQNFQTMPIQSGFNEDVIANGVGPSLNSTTTILDGDSYVFVARDFLSTATSTPITYGVPVDGIINSVAAATPGLSYQLGNMTGPNSLRLSNTNLSGTLTFATPKAATKLYMLSTSGSAASTLTVTVNFTDGTNQQVTGIAVPDWYNGTNFAVQGLGRINRTNDDLDAAGGTNPRMYQATLTIDAANQTKLIQSVNVTKTSTSNGFPNIFAFSADAYSDCNPPTVQAATNITANGATLNWTPSPGTQATGYNIYYSTSATIPTSSTAPIISNFNGTSTPIGSLASNTTYYFWVKTNCNTTTGQSAWSFGGNFKTLCGPMTLMSENFDSYATGNNLPDCWSRLMGSNGSLSISATSPASGTRNIYQYSGTTQSTSIAVFPEISNLTAGTHWLRLKARVSSTPGTLNIGYVTDPADAATFTLIQTLSLTNSNYGPDYFVSIPTTLPANARLAIKNNADAKSYYWDDVRWEAVPTCTPPANIVTSNASPNSIDVAWNLPASGAASGYEYYYSPVSSASPTATTTASGTFPANAVSGIISGLNPNQTYTLWMRTVCSATDKSEWTYQVAFRTTCAPTPSLFEDFEYFAAGSIVPDCWARIVTNGSQTISTTSPASGVRNIYQYATASNTPSVVVLPEFTNISAGTHRIRMKARMSSGTGNLNIGYVTNVSDASTFVNIETLSITNTSYGTDYMVDIPTTVPSNARVAIRNTNDGRSYYWDDLYWEPKNSLSTSETSVKKKITVYPNPFSNALFISEPENVRMIKVSDVAGRVVKVIENPSKEINVSTLNSGLYLITMYFKDGSQHTVKTIKK